MATGIVTAGAIAFHPFGGRIVGWGGTEVQALRRAYEAGEPAPAFGEVEENLSTACATERLIDALRDGKVTTWRLTWNGHVAYVADLCD